MKISLFIPTLNAGEIWSELVNSINSQRFSMNEKLIIDSGSQDKTVQIAKKNGFEVINISKNEFNHGGTRNKAIESLKDNDVIIFLTQDVILANNYSLENLIKPFEDPEVACVYGRQLPHKNANPLAIHARLYNYPNESLIKDASLIPKIGFKVSHISNAFAAYRTSVFREVGTFPTDVIIAEDTYLASLIIKAGLKIVYAADAEVFHSHNYSPIEEFKRYFDTGVFHKQNAWIRTEFGEPDGEGLRYIKKELNYILKHNLFWLIPAVFSNGMKWLGFKLGQNYNFLPRILLKPFSMHKNYWNKNFN
ncbi:glycosyltransferase [Pelobium sp.]|nr:glycosyltransferase [Pelobium sp.]MDA9555552.1 glycosyltransferase [Pelobium sp.]